MTVVRRWFATGTACAVLAACTGAPAPAPPSVEIGDTGIVQIVGDAPYGGYIEEGSGIVIDPDGLVLTVFHVVVEANAIDVTVPGSGKTYRATVAGYDRSADVALLALADAHGLATVPLGDSMTVGPGDGVVARGNSAGTGRPLTRWEGAVTGLDAELNVTGRHQAGMITTDADVDHGDSGGPLFNTAGEVIALNDARVGDRAFHVPIDQALAIADLIRSGTPSPTVHVGPPAAMGVGIDVHRHGTARTNFGVPVREVFPWQPAERAGVKTGGVIVAIDGTPVTSWLNLLEHLDLHVPGDVVDVTWIDHALASRTAAVTLVAGRDGSRTPDLLWPVAS